MNTVERALEIRQYTEGDCVIFAVEAAALTGGEPVFITDDDETGHAMCLLPDGRLFDVRGVFAADGTLHEHCPAMIAGHVFLGRNALGVIEHEVMGLPEPEMQALGATPHRAEHDKADHGDRVFARMAAERIWAECR